MTAPAAVKPCRKCGEEKPLGDFPRNRAARDGRHHYCRGCAHEQTRAWRATNAQRQWTHNVAAYCQARGVPLTPEARALVPVIYADPCWYCKGDRSGPRQRQIDHVVPIARGGL